MSEVHRERGLLIDSGVAAELLFHGNREDLEEMLGNLMDNACKWARSRVSVSAGLQERRLRITVTDDGPGIAADELERVRRRGVRLDETIPGAGLGLSIVSVLALSYGGDLELTDEAGRGFRATLVLPGSAAR